MNKKLDLENVRVYSNTKNDVADAINLIGQMVYVSDDTDFRTYIKGKLFGVSYVGDNVYTKYPFVCENEKSVHYKYFILEKDAKFIEEKEKKLRPFKSIIEFGWETGCKELGDTITFKMINGKFDETSIFTGYRTLWEKNQTIILLGGMGYTLEELKEDYLYFKDGEFHPFGIEE